MDRSPDMMVGLPPALGLASASRPGASYMLEGALVPVQT